MAASPVWQTTVKRANLSDAKTPGSTLFDVELPGLVGIQGIESFVEARRVQQELQVLFAAVFEEVDDFFVLLHGFDDLRLFERARVVFVDHNKALPGGVQELARELGDLLRGGLGLGLARLGALRELVPQRRLDRLLPARNVDR